MDILKKHSKKEENINLEHDLFFSLIDLNNLDFYTRKLVNVFIPNNNLYTKIDMILINQKGIYVIEYKSYRGNINGKHNSRYWEYTYKEKKEKFLNPINENESHIKTLRKIFNIENDNKKLFKSYILFDKLENCDLENIIYNESRTLKVINKDNLLDTLKIDNRASKNILSKKQVDYIFDNLKKYTDIDINKKYIDDYLYNNK